MCQTKLKLLASISNRESWIWQPADQWSNEASLSYAALARGAFHEPCGRPARGDDRQAEFVSSEDQAEAM